MNNAASLRRLVLAALAAGAMALPGIALAQAAGGAAAPLTAPEALVQTVSNDLLEVIRADKALQSGDIDRLNRLVDEKVLPHVDFEKMTRLAVGPAWRQATAEQRQALIREFRGLLTYTYAGAISNISDHKVQLRPSRFAPTDTDVIVRSQVVASRGEPIQLDYRMEKKDAGWKIYDVNILGVWLVESYRQQFASQINNGGIDGLIKTLVERNRQLAAAPRKS